MYSGGLQLPSWGASQPVQQLVWVPQGQGQGMIVQLPVIAAGGIVPIGIEGAGLGPAPHIRMAPLLPRSGQLVSMTHTTGQFGPASVPPPIRVASDPGLPSKRRRLEPEDAAAPRGTSAEHPAESWDHSPAESGQTLATADGSVSSAPLQSLVLAEPHTPTILQEQAVCLDCNTRRTAQWYPCRDMSGAAIPGQFR